MPKATREKTNKSKKRTNKIKQENIEKNTKEDKFSFDEEIVIGLKRIDEPEVVRNQNNKNRNKDKKRNQKNINKNSKNKNYIKSKNKNKNIDDINDSGVIIRSKYMSNYEEVDEEYSNIGSKDNKKINNSKKNKKQKNKKSPKKLTKQQELSRKKRKKIFKFIKILFLIAVIVGGIIYAMLSPIFNIKDISVTGNSKISSELIISLSELNIDQNIFSFRTSEVKNKVKQNAYVNNVEIKRKLPDSVEINVEERIATFMLTLGNAYVYINNQGYILEITSKKLELPILIGYTTQAEEIVEGNRLNQEDLEKLNDVLKIMEATSSGENDISKLINQIDIKDSNNYILDLKSEKKKVYLGDTTNLSTKALWINKFLKEEKKNEGIIYLNMNLNIDRPYFREKV